MGLSVGRKPSPAALFEHSDLSRKRERWSTRYFGCSFSAAELMQ
ncbi:hypothetical protein ACVJGD_004240 [Bradyrhizobium sp. USDA 10063]